MANVCCPPPQAIGERAGSLSLPSVVRLSRFPFLFCKSSAAPPTTPRAGWRAKGPASPRSSHGRKFLHPSLVAKPIIPKQKSGLVQIGRCHPYVTKSPIGIRTFRNVRSSHLRHDQPPPTPPILRLLANFQFRCSLSNTKENWLECLFSMTPTQIHLPRLATLARPCFWTLRLSFCCPAKPYRRDRGAAG